MEISGFKIQQTGVIDLTKHELIEKSPELEKRAKSLGQSATQTFNNPIDPNHPLNAPYAEIHIPGRGGRQDVVIKIDNNGFTQTPNGFFQQYGISFDRFSSLGKGLQGPELARIRAEEIARSTNGTINLASTAISGNNPYPNSFTYTQKELAEAGLSFSATLQAEIARLKFQQLE